MVGSCGGDEEEEDAQGTAQTSLVLWLYRDAGNQNQDFPPGGGSEPFNRPDANSANFDGCQCVPSGPEVDQDNPNTDCTTNTNTSPIRCWGTLVCPDGDQSLKCHDQGEKCRGEGGGNPGFGYAPEGVLCIYDGNSDNFKYVVTTCRAESVGLPGWLGYVSHAGTCIAIRRHHRMEVGERTTPSSRCLCLCVRLLAHISLLGAQVLRHPGKWEVLLGRQHRAHAPKICTHPSLKPGGGQPHRWAVVPSPKWAEASMACTVHRVLTWLCSEPACAA